MQLILSIVIPFRDSKKFINKNLLCCNNIAKNLNIEIIYVDNCSSENIDFFGKKISKIKNIALYKTKKKEGFGPGIARNLGIRKSKSKFILFLDIDDLINENKFHELLNYLKKTNANIINLKKVLIKNKRKITSIPKYINYSKNNLKPFFIKQNNMESIGIVFKKNFLTKNKIFFQRGIYEDIFFVFKSYYFNTKKIEYFKKEIYKKFFYKNSITNRKLSLQHIEFKFLAFKKIISFLKKNLSKHEYANIKDNIQFRLRGEFANHFISIKKSRYNGNKSYNFIEYLKKKYIKLLNKNFLIKTKKDQLVNNIINV